MICRGTTLQRKLASGARPSIAPVQVGLPAEAASLELAAVEYARMALSPDELSDRENKIAEMNAQIERKRARLAEKVGPIQEREIEQDIEEKEGLVRGWMNEEHTP